MNRLTLFGELVEALQDHFEDEGGLKLGKPELVHEITGQRDSSQASRYMREFKADKELFWYHKYTISRIIAKASPSRVPDPRLLRKIGMGYSFIGQRDDVLTAETLGNAIGQAMGRGLKQYLTQCPLRPESPFCAKMCRLYGERYGGQGARASDLESYVLAVDESLDDRERSQEIYRRILLAILLGPEATSAIASISTTASTAAPDSESESDGFALTQLSVRDGAIVPVATYGFEMGVEVSIGLPANPEAVYFPEFDDGIRPFVSFEHALIRQSGEPGRASWQFVNLSVTNGSAVRRENGEILFTRTRGDCIRLYPGDELWLAPVSGPSGTVPEYRRGAVIRFEHLYPMAGLISHVNEAVRPCATVDVGTAAATPVYGESAEARAATKSKTGFTLGDLSLGTGSRVFHYEDLADEDGFFSVSLGRRGDYEVGMFLGSAVARRHACIESLEDSDLVMLTNQSNNEVVVRHRGGTFDEIGKWQYLTLSDGDELYLAGGVTDSGPHAAANGVAISFNYLYKVVEQSC